ncbi:hypothetical protein ACEWBD_20955 [Vibrio parahaemolyticus]
MDISSISTALAGLKSATEIATWIKNSGSTLEDAETKLKLAELINALADTKVEVANFKELLLEKDEIIRGLQQEKSTQASVVWEEPFYFMIEEENQKIGPYCQCCYDSDGSLVRVLSPAKNGYWSCHKCDSGYRDSTYKTTIQTVRRRNVFGNY